MRRVVSLLLALAGALPLPIPAAHAQRAILLELRPRAGDTLHMRLEQRVELTGTMKVGDTDSSVTAVNTMRLHARTIVQRSDGSGATVLSITDSVYLSSEPPQLPPQALEQVRRALEGQQVRLRLTPDGAAQVLSDPDQLPAEMQGVLGPMPATLPARSVVIGERWTQTMRLPGTARTDLTGPLALKATFRLDSISGGGRYAWVSMSGELSRTEGVALPGGGTYRTSGTLEGYLKVDRERGWITESTSVVSVRSIMEPPPGTDAEPMHVRMRTTQRIRTLDKR